MRLICLPHAGGGAVAFHAFAALLPDSIEMMAVQLPGRETRIAEPPLRRMGPLVEALADGIEHALTKPYAFFGHSMGALVAFELARTLRRRGQRMPATIIVSGRRAPNLPQADPPLHHLPDDAFVEALVRRSDAIPKVVLDEPALMAMFVPVLKADFAVFETHVHRDEPRLHCGLALYGGRADPQTAQMAGWADLFSGPCRTRLFDGGHFYLADQRRAVAAALAEDVLARN
jgi:medium-chain acyl-[acyl-carrier-protein] hydrolase